MSDIIIVDGSILNLMSQSQARESSVDNIISVHIIMFNIYGHIDYESPLPKGKRIYASFVIIARPILLKSTEYLILRSKFLGYSEHTKTTSSSIFYSFVVYDTHTYSRCSEDLYCDILEFKPQVIPSLYRSTITSAKGASSKTDMPCP